MFALGWWHVRLQRVWRFLGQRRTRYVLAWFLALLTAINGTYVVWNQWNRENRVDGNDGHASIDFGSQWLMGRMLALDKGQDLYERDHLREVLKESYPVYLEGTANTDSGRPSDADQLMNYLMGRDTPNEKGRHIGGPLYPPLNAFVHWPLGLFNPRAAYHIYQVAQAVLVFFAALAVSFLSRGRIWTPIAALLIFFAPDFFGNQVLGQNSIITLVIVLWGWVLISRDQEVWGGVVWGLLSYKPVWAMSFFFVLVLTRRWRGGMAMLAAGVLFADLTLPFVGVESWLEWRQIAAEVAWGNRVYRNWIFLSRTLFSIPRRWLTDFNLPESERTNLETDIVCWALYLLVIELSVRLIVTRRRAARAVCGPGAAFVLASAWLCCFQFMYYDELVMFPAVIVLFLDPGSLLQPRYLAQTSAQWQWLRLRPWRRLRTMSIGDSANYATGRATVLSRRAPAAYGWLKNPLVLLPVATIYLLPNYFYARGLVTDYDPYSVYCVLALWAWCGWLWTRECSVARSKVPSKTALPAATRGAAAAPEEGNGRPPGLQSMLRATR